jgi:hypothetical protein
MRKSIECDANSPSKTSIVVENGHLSVHPLRPEFSLQRTLIGQGQLTAIRIGSHGLEVRHSPGFRPQLKVSRSPGLKVKALGWVS